MVKFIQRYEALRIHQAHMNTWLEIDDDGGGRKRGRKSRVVYGEEVEGPLLRGHEAQSISTAGAAEEDASDDGDGTGDCETQDLEQREEEEKAAEGLRVWLGKHGGPRMDAHQHMVYPDPTLSIAVNPGAGRVRGLDIIDQYGATDLIWALGSYLKKNTTRQHLPHFFLPTVHHHFLVWN
ncbi:hypothetical protein FRC06_011124 [Ceratobasidium sp. 370]|nr:hypothetical protein FRC06_011124 [Ceratobasidium sp. 370]